MKLITKFLLLSILLLNWQQEWNAHWNMWSGFVARKSYWSTAIHFTDFYVQKQIKHGKYYEKKVFWWMTIYLTDFYDLWYDRYCAQRKGKKCRASLRLYPDGRLMQVVTEHSHPTPPINTRVYLTTNPNDLYYDVDNHEQIDLVTLINPLSTKAVSGQSTVFGL